MIILKRCFSMFLLLMLVFTGVHAAVADSVVVDARSNRGSSCSGGSDYVSKNGVIVTSTNATMGQGDVYRFYQGASVTVSSAAGNITKIVFVSPVAGKDRYGPGNFSSVSTGSYSVDGTVGTWTGNARSVTFSAGTNQVRAFTIMVYRQKTADGSMPLRPSLKVGSDTPFPLE